MQDLDTSKAAILPILIGGMLISSVACSPSPAHADCRSRLKTISNNYRGVQQALPQKVRANLNRLHQSGQLLVTSGRQSLCNDVADAMHSIMQDHHDVIQKAQRQMRFANAPPVAQIKGVMRASEVNGATVKNKKANTIGTIKDIVLDPSGRIAYAALSADGKLIAVPWRSFKFVRKSNTLVLAISTKRLQNMQGFNTDNWPMHANKNLQSKASPKR